LHNQATDVDYDENVFYKFLISGDLIRIFRSE